MVTTDDLAVAIVERVAERKGVDVVDLHPPLYEAIDADALETLLESSSDGSNQISVTFSYNGYTIRVDDSETIRIEKLRSEAVPAPQMCDSW